GAKHKKHRRPHRNPSHKSLASVAELSRRGAACCARCSTTPIAPTYITIPFPGIYSVSFSICGGKESDRFGTTYESSEHKLCSAAQEIPPQSTGGHDPEDSERTVFPPDSERSLRAKSGGPTS